MPIKKHYSKLSPVQKKLAFDAIDFCYNKFLSKKRKTVTIKIQGVPELLRLEAMYGDCDYEYPDDGGLPTEFLIRLDNTLPTALFLRTLMHELVHVKQWCKGEMRQMLNEKTMTFKWHSEKINLASTNYYDYPWEIEAHGREEGLTVQFYAQKPEWKIYMDEKGYDYEF